MKALELYESKPLHTYGNERDRIAAICNRYKIDEYIINDDLTVDANEVDFSMFHDLEEIPLKFNNVINFNISETKIRSLKNSPRYVDEHMDCNESALESLEGGPEKVGILHISFTGVSSLVGLPKLTGTIKNSGYYCNNLPNLTSLKGCPEVVDGFIDLSRTGLESLEGGPKVVNGWIDLNNTRIMTLQGMPKVINGAFTCKDTNIETPWDLRFLLTCKIPPRQVVAIHIDTVSSSINYEISQRFERFFQQSEQERKRAIPEFLTFLKGMSL